MVLKNLGFFAEPFTILQAWQLHPTLKKYGGLPKKYSCVFSLAIWYTSCLSGYLIRPLPLLSLAALLPATV